MLTAAKRFDKHTWYPDYGTVKKLHAQLTKQTGHNEIGPGGFMDDIIEWVLEAQKHWLEHKQILERHYVPRLTSYSVRALKYERLFLTMALRLWQQLPNTAIDVSLVAALGNWITVLLTYDPNVRVLEMPPEIVNLKVDAFIRPEKKILKQQQSMKTNRGV